MYRDNMNNIYKEKFKVNMLNLAKDQFKQLSGTN